MYKEQTFSLPELAGISSKSVAEHLKLYAGYVKFANLVNEKIKEYSVDSEKNSYVLGELQRRFSFEWNGMRNHEYYFRSLEGGAKPLPQNSTLKTQIEKQWGSWEAWLASMKALALTRGIGWAMLYYDPTTSLLTHAWVDEQHLGQLNGLPLILGIDMWEHSFYMDYGTNKKAYVDAFFQNLNWETIEAHFVKAQN